MSDESLKRAERERQIATLIQEQFKGIAPTDEEIATIEREALSNPALVMECVLLTNRSRSSVNMLYMAIQVLNLRARVHVPVENDDLDVDYPRPLSEEFKRKLGET